MPILIKLDVTKIDKSKLFKGRKGTYLDVVLIESKFDKYGNDYLAVQGVSKEERERGVNGAILGRAKITGKGNPKSATPPTEADEPIPF